MKKNIEVHFAILDSDDIVANGFVGLRHYRSDLFILFVTSQLFHHFKEKIDNALENLRILLPDLKVEYHNVNLNDYWGIFFKAHDIAKTILERNNNVNFFANITTSNRIAAMALRDALASIDCPAICYYYKQGIGEEERSEIIEVPISPPLREINKTIPILRSLYENGGRADSIEDVARDVGGKISKSDNFGSQAKLVEYYIRKLEIYAVVKTVPGKKREVLLTGSSFPVSRVSTLVSEK